jgi:two-component system, NtrC family, sensor kinase
MMERSPVMSESQPNGSAPIVLYVDDELPNRVVFEQCFNPYVPIVTVDGGRAALEVLAQRDVGVVVTDMRMPDMSGDELLRIVKEKHPRTVRMVATAYADIDPIVRSINEGLVSRYILKPWQNEEVVRCLRWGIEAWWFGRDAEELKRRLIETERLATLGTFSAMFSHDVRTPLTSALISHNLVELDSVPRLRALLAELPLAADQRARVDAAIDAIMGEQETISLGLGMAVDFLTALRDFTHPEQAKTVALKSANALEVVDHTVKVCRTIARRNNIEIAVRVPSELPEVAINPVSLAQVLCNLLQNAAQAVSARGLVNGQVSIAARARVDEVELKVVDQGVGMEPDVLSRVGTMFFTTKPDGQGLGLAQCQRLVGGAGGRLKIDSQPGVGTTVTVILPTT